MRPIFLDGPPPDATNGFTRTSDRIDFVAALKTRPGHWAQYKPGKKHSPGSAAVMQKDFPGIQARTRRREDGGNDIYARWMGQ